jgi:hypothetical protein
MQRILIASLIAFTTTASAAPRGSGAIDRTAIRRVDFANRTYYSQLGDEPPEPVAVVNGVFERPSERDGARNGFFMVRPAVYGDVDGDGVEDAIVVAIDNGGGTGMFDDARVFALRAGRVVEIARIPGGDRGDGGLHAVAAETGGVRVERYDNDGGGACCPRKLAIEHWRWTGRGLELDPSRTVVVAS